MSEVRLIDANELKKEVCIKFYTTPYYKHILDVIDNAPTVETDIEVIAKDAYEHGYTDGWKERFGEPNERPKGEWIIIDDCEQFIVKCSRCGRIEDSRLIKDYPFCRCGADMRGNENGLQPN